MNEAKSFGIDLYLTNMVGELPNSQWNQAEKDALLQSAKFIKEWTNLRSSILFHMFDNGEGTTEEAQSRIQYWKDVINGQNRSSPELPSAISKENRATAKEILESYRRELAKDILKKTGALETAATQPQQTITPPTEETPEINRTIQRSAPIITEDITVIDEDYIAEFVATHSGNQLDEFYHKHLVPAYKAILADMQEGIKNKPTDIPVEKFRKDNEMFINHAEFLRHHIKLVRDKLPTVDAPIPVLTDIVEPSPMSTAKIEARPVVTAAQSTPANDEPQAIEDKPTSLFSNIGGKLKSLFNGLARKLTPTPRLGWDLATGTGLVAGAALAAAMQTAPLQSGHIKELKAEPASTLQVSTATALEAAPKQLDLTRPVTLQAAQSPEATQRVSTQPVASQKPFTKALQTEFGKTAKTAAEPDSGEILAHSEPIVEKSFDIAEFRQDLSTLEKACRYVGADSTDSICNGLRPQ